MTPDYISPLVTSVVSVINTMCTISPKAGIPVKAKKISEKELAGTWGIVTGVIGLDGSNTKGTLILSFDEPCILDLVSKMLMEEHKVISQETMDVVGELTNIITGSIKREIAELGYSIEMATPVVISGQGKPIEQILQSELTTIPFNTPAGNFVIETNLSKV